MAKAKPDAAPQLTPPRAARLYRLITLLADGPHLRTALTKKLKVDTRGFYRDLEFLRGLGIPVSVTGTRYQLLEDLDAALARLPVPDPGLSVRDALVLARGTTDAHRRFRRRLESYLGPARGG